MSKKLNILLDLDEMCISQRNVPSKKEFDNFDMSNKENNLEKHKLKFRFESRNYENSDKKYEYVILFLRPNIRKFLKYLFDNHTVSVWTNAYHINAKQIIDIMFSSTQKKKLKYLIAANEDLNSKPIIHGPYDVKTKQYLYNFNEIKSVRKDLSYLFKNKPYSNLFSPDNTILLDDSITHYQFNKGNVIRVKEFNGEENDNIMDQVLEYLKNTKNLNTKKLKNFMSNTVKNTKKKVKKE
jgi:TFIIF-interacting CTD phosphatase-like protein